MAGVSGVLAATAGPTALWYLTRGAGLVSLVLLTAVVALGVVASNGWGSDRYPRFYSQGLHRNLSVFALVLIGLHIVTTVADGFAPIGYLDAVLPFRSPYRPLWLGLGALAFDLLLALAATSALRHRIGYRSWRLVHWLAYLCWPVALLHGLGTGTDTHLGPVVLLDAGCVAVVLAAVAWRLGVGWPDQAPRRLAGGASALALTVAVAAFALTGPLRPGWSRRAGTPLPTAALGAATVPAPATVRPSAAVGADAGSTVGTLPAPPFDTGLAGSYRTSGPDAAGMVTVDIRARLDGLATPLDVSLRGTPAGSGVAMTASRVTLGPASGSVVALDGDRVVAVVTGPDGTALRLVMRLSIDRAAGSVTGAVRGLAGTAGAGGGGEAAGDDSGGGDG